MEEKNNKTNEEKNVVESNNNGNKGLIIVLILIILGLGAYIAYDKLVLDKDTKVEESLKGNGKKEETKKEEPAEKEEEKKEEEPSEENTTKYTLFNEEVLLEDVCPGLKCDKDLGKFTLGNVEHEASLIFIGGEPVNEQSIYLDDIRIKNTDMGNYHKIVKIGEDYLAIGRTVDPSTSYEIKIYDSKLTPVKDYYSIYIPRSIARDEKMYNNYKDYFKVEGNTFTRYGCDTSKDTDGTKQKLVKYLVTINNGEFTEKEVSRVEEYCSAQS